MKKGAQDFIKVNILLCGIDTSFFLIYKIGDWSLKADLLREISSTTKLIG